MFSVQTIQFGNFFQDAYHHFETVLMKTRDVLDQNYVQQVLQSQGVDLNIVNDAFDGAHFERDVIQSLCDSASIIEAQLEQIEEQRRRYEQDKEREQEEKAEREQSEKAAAEHVQEEKVFSAVDDVSPWNLQRYENLVKFKYDHLQGLILNYSKLRPFYCGMAAATSLKCKQTVAFFVGKGHSLIFPHGKGVIVLICGSI